MSGTFASKRQGYVGVVETVGWVVAFTVIDLTVSSLLFRWMREPYRTTGPLALMSDRVGCAVHAASTFITIVLLVLGAAALDQLS